MIDEILSGETVPCIGPGALVDVRHEDTGESIPAESNDLILGLNQGRPLAPRLMFEFSRAAMHVENKRGRRAVEKYLESTYGQQKWTKGALHQWIESNRLNYVVDLNRDQLLIDAYRGRPHIVILGLARLGGTDYRFKLFEWGGEGYKEKSLETITEGLPVLFKPLGAPIPEPHFVASDADFVDYITELMGGFAIPSFLKGRRKGKRYALLGLRFTRDTERMVMSDIMFDAADDAGYALIPSPTEKERRWCERKHLQVVDATIEDFLRIAGRERLPATESASTFQDAVP